MPAKAPKPASVATRADAWRPRQQKNEKDRELSGYTLPLQSPHVRTSWGRRSVHASAAARRRFRASLAVRRLGSHIDVLKLRARIVDAAEEDGSLVVQRHDPPGSRPKGVGCVRTGVLCHRVPLALVPASSMSDSSVVESFQRFNGWAFRASRRSVCSSLLTENQHFNRSFRPHQHPFELRTAG
jgi:hypothetical protein